MSIPEDQITQAARLGRLITNARNHVMESEEFLEQIVSFVYGNLQLEGICATKEEVRESVKRIGWRDE